MEATQVGVLQVGVHRIAHIVHMAVTWGRVEATQVGVLQVGVHRIAHIVHVAESGGYAGWRVAGWRAPYSTYSTYSNDMGESGGDAGWRVEVGVHRIAHIVHIAVTWGRVEATQVGVLRLAYTVLHIQFI